MSSRFDLLTQELFQKNISDCSVEELRSLAEQYPYFSPAQYALSKKLQQTDSEAYQAQFQKAVLYYHDPAGFHHFINEENFAVEDFIPETVVTPVIETEELLPIQEVTPEESIVAEPEIIEEEKEEENAPQLDVTIHKEPEAPVVNSDEPKTPVAETNGTADTGLTFEPYHTVDYFASQGIRLSQEEATKDRFGRQLKSFTEWLKTMKKLPAAEQAKPIDTIDEQKVEQLATHSVQESDVVTETMAEVWIKQGRIEKAIEVYNKLSLLNPSKNAYFAAKVEFLKKDI